MERLLLLGLNHQTAPLDLRERLALSLTEQEALLRELVDRGWVEEAFLLVTCNRLECYVVAGALPPPELLADVLGSRRGVPSDEVMRRAYVKRQRDAAEHAFHVAAGLDSMVVGETQVLGQFRDAYERACRLKVTGVMLDPLLQRAIACGRDVAKASGLRKVRPSVPGVAVELARRQAGGLAGKTVLCVGAGKIGAILLRRLAELGSTRSLVLNRDLTRARTIAAPLNAEAYPLDRLADLLPLADVVLSSTGAVEPVITRELLKRARPAGNVVRPLVMVDLALPRDIEPSVVELPGVRLLNLADLQAAADERSPQWQQAIARARRIVQEHVADYEAWRRRQSLGPVIDRLYRRSHALAEREVERALADFPGIDDAERAHWRELARRVVNQLLHLPVRRLGESDCPQSSAEAYLHALEHLFSLDHDDGSREPRGYPVAGDDQSTRADD